MPRFFVENADASVGDTIMISGGDARHISRSLRMRPGERLTVCDGLGSDMHCVIDSLSDDAVMLRVEVRMPSDTEPSVHVTLYQGYPKGDKLETIIEKAVELGVFSVVPVLTERSVARPDANSAARKRERWQRHSLEAAKQCGRGIIPNVEDVLHFSGLGTRIASHSAFIYFYELGGKPLTVLLGSSSASDIGIFIGPEGGISAEECAQLDAWGAVPATLGKRILRTETAPLAALSAIMLLTGNLS